MELLNALVRSVLYALLILSGTTLVFFLVLLVARVRKRDYTTPRKVATWTGIATSVGSLAISALNVRIPIGIAPESDPAREAIRAFYAALEDRRRCPDAWKIIHGARKEKLKQINFAEAQFCGAYETTLTYENFDIQRLDAGHDGRPTRVYRVAYDVEDEFPRNDLFDLRLKDFRDFAKTGQYDQQRLTDIVMNNLRLYYVVSPEAENRVRELIANTPLWFTGAPEFIAELRRLLKVKYLIDLPPQKSPPPFRRIKRHYVHNLTMMEDEAQWKILDGLAAPLLVAPYVPRERVL